MSAEYPPSAAVPDSLDVRWLHWRARAAAQDERWHTYALIVAVLLGCGFAVAVAGVLYAG